MEIKEIHRLLSLPSNASYDEVKRSYRSAIKREHPDVGGDSGRFMRLKSAWDEYDDWVLRGLGDSDRVIFGESLFDLVFES